MNCRLSNSRASEDVAQTAAIMAIGLDNVVQSARSVALKSSTVASSRSSSSISMPMFSLAEEPITDRYDVLDDEEQYLSPQQRLERRKEKQTMKAEAHYKVTNQVGLSSSR